MNKYVIMFCLVIFELVGGYLPVLIFKVDMFSGWGILGGAIGGFFWHLGWRKNITEVGIGCHSRR